MHTIDRDLPRLVISPDLQSSNIPYEVEFDNLEYAELLDRMGMPEERIAKLQVTLKRKPEFKARIVGSESLMGINWVFTNNIAVYTDPSWNDGQDLIKGNATTQEAYVHSNISVNSTLVHESQHRVNQLRRKGVAAAGMGIKALATGIPMAAWYVPASRILEATQGTPQYPIYSAVTTFALFVLFACSPFGRIGYALNPDERSARRAQEEFLKRADWKDIIKLNPK